MPNDIVRPKRVGSLFSGIGGFSLAARKMGWSTAWFSEIEPYPIKVLAKNFPGVPNLGDVTKINGREVERVDVLTGGFPCQDLSVAGRGAGLDGARSGLWFHYARLIDELRPSWVVAENVSALRGRGLDRVLGSLDALGYDAEWHCIPASHVGAPHRRDRIWIVAHPHHNAREGRAEQGALFQGREPAAGKGADVRREREPRPDHTGPGGAVVAHPHRAGLAERLVLTGSESESGCPHERENSAVDGRWPPEPNVGRVAHGVPARVDRIKCLGNSLVHRIPLAIFRAIELQERAWGGG